MDIRNPEEDVYEEAQKTRTIRNDTAEMTKHARRGEKQEMRRRNINNSTTHTESIIWRDKRQNNRTRK